MFLATKVGKAKCFLALLILASSLNCKSDYAAMLKQPTPSDNKNPIKKVKLISVKQESIEETIPVTGTLSVYDQTIVSVKVPGRIKEINIDLGTVVKKGQLIAQIDPQDYKLRLEQSQAALAQARARLGLNPEGIEEPTDPTQISLVREAKALVEDAKVKKDRVTALLKQGIISQSDYDSAETSYKVAISKYEDAVEEFNNRRALLVQRRSEVEIARQQLADTSIYAPFDGVVQEKRTSLGEFLSASAPIATIVRIDPLRLRAEVPERNAGRIKIGQKIKVAVEGDSNTYSGQIMRLSPALTEQNRMLLVEAEISNNGTLRPGSFAKAEIVVNPNYPVNAIPKTAVVTFAGIEKVITVSDGKALEKTITTGQNIKDQVEVLSGLKAGDEVVAEPGNLQSGQAVEVTK